MSAITRRLTDCVCGEPLTIVRSTPNPYDDGATIVEAVRCPDADCRLGGHRVVDATDDCVVRRVGPALQTDPTSYACASRNVTVRVPTAQTTTDAEPEGDDE